MGWRLDAAGIFVACAYGWVTFVVETTRVFGVGS